MRRRRYLARRHAATWMVAAALLPLAAMHRGTPAQSVAAGLSGYDQRSSAAAVTDPVVTLVTGDKVRLTRLPDGGYAADPVLTASAGRTGSTGFVQFAWDGDSYAVPYAAVPYLGSLLDPRLFDISYLVRAGLDDARSSKLPLAISYAGGAPGDTGGAPGVRGDTGGGRTLPGLRVNSAGLGVLAKSGAPAFGALLAADWRALRGGAHLPAADPLHSIARIGLSPGPGRPSLPALPPPGVMQTRTTRGGASPHYRTLTINVTGLDGKPGVAVGWVQNLGDPLYGAFDESGLGFSSSGQLIGQPGPIHVSVPDGTYSIQFVVLTPHPGTFEGVDAALVTKPQVSIGSNAAVTLDARTARPYKYRSRGSAPATA